MGMEEKFKSDRHLTSQIVLHKIGNLSSDLLKYQMLFIYYLLVIDVI